jgi:phosphate transport system substrate-binding protein
MLPLTGPCGFSQSATPDAIKSEDYPFTSPVYVYLAPYRLPQLVRQFLDFTRSEEAERVVAGAGYRRPVAYPHAAWIAGRTPRQCDPERGRRRETSKRSSPCSRGSNSAERLSPTFRFGDGAAELDTQSRAAVGRLAAAIEAGLFDGRTLIFAGFSDSAGSAQINTRLALRRAETVLEAVRAATVSADARVTLRAEAFGEVLPMACEDTDWDAAVNRRVEVWLE